MLTLHRSLQTYLRYIALCSCIASISLTVLSSNAEPPTESTEAEDEQELVLKKAKEPYASAQMGDAGPFEKVSFQKGIEFKDPDSAFKVALRFRMQNRMEGQHDLDSNKTIGDGQIRRMRLRFNGTAADPRFHFLIQLSFSRDDIEWKETQFPNIIRDAMILYSINPQWSIGFGQGKLPGNRQRVVSSGDLQFTDRSQVNSLFNIGRDMGVQSQWTFYSPAPVILKTAVSTGEGRNQSDPADQHMSYTGRAEWLPLGKFEDNGDYFEGDLAFEEKARVSLGAGAAFMDGTSRSNGGNGAYMLNPYDSSGKTYVSRAQHVYFADMVFKKQGHSLFIEFARRDMRDPMISATQSFAKGWGINAQYGYMYRDKREVAWRYTAFRPSTGSSIHHPSLNEWAAVHNFFIAGHRIKLQTEVGLRESESVYGRVQFEYGI